MYDELIKRLREHVEWAKDSEWETPITLSDDLGSAIDAIEALSKVEEDLKFLEFLWNVINPNQMESYIAMYNAQGVQTNG